ncbi:hypothetical protein Zmor_002469 [Zophobas morio]|uniref:Uncharacterized protein n=1 Tax=Zophobas morio TaxID=2755281 RepID=A0AA38J870_9CUCU|nr:hypothetical protein Zmor_002469 [Zophobas morio]
MISRLAGVADPVFLPHTLFFVAKVLTEIAPGPWSSVDSGNSCRSECLAIFWGPVRFLPSLLARSPQRFGTTEKFGDRAPLAICPSRSRRATVTNHRPGAVS